MGRPDRPPRIMITAGETSGDLLGAGLARAIREIEPGVELTGMGGEAMSRAGVRLIQDLQPVSVVGLVEVLAHLPEIRKAMARLKQAIRDHRPDILVPIDFPDFNLRLASWARSRDVPVVYYVSPQVWAWRRGRIRSIREIVRRMLVLFPFEERFYRDEDVPATFVGHPVAERVPAGGTRECLAGVLQSAGLDPEGDTVALVPGSRPGEVRRILPRLLGAARRLRERRPDLQFLLSRAPGIDTGWLREEVGGQDPGGLAVHGGDFPEVLRGCVAGAVASGTATLEAAMTGLPMVVVYRMNTLSYLLGRMMVNVDHVAMPNLVAGRRVLPELVQGDCTPARIAAELGDLLDDAGRREEIGRGLGGIRDRLQGPGAYRRAAEAVLNYWNP